MKPLRILITGASSGLGLHALLRLIKIGHSVIAGVRGGDARLAEILAKEGVAGSTWAVDLHLDKAETFGLAARAVDRHFGGHLDVLINNAGYGLFGAIEDQSLAQIRRQFEVNTFGPVGLTQALLPQLRAARGRIINVSSAADFWTMPLYGTYCASKAALASMSEAMYYDLRPEGLQVGLLEPGGFRTNFIGTAKVLADGSRSRERVEALNRFFAKVESRLVHPDRIAQKLVSLCERRRLPLRNLVGSDAWLAGFMARMLPWPLRVRLQEWLYRKFVFKE